MIKNTECNACLNTNCFVKLYCTSQWVQQIGLNKNQIVYYKSQNIINEGAPVLGIYFIQKGKVKVFSTGLNGRPHIVRFANTGHILGHRGLGNEVYPISAAAMEDTTVCFIANELLNELFVANPKFSIGLMMFYSRELRKIEERMKNLAQMNVREKIAEALLLLYENFGLNNKGELNVALTRDDIADIAGTVDQQVSRQFTEFEEEGIIKKVGKRVAIVHLDRLKGIIGDYNLHHIYHSTGI